MVAIVCIFQRYGANQAWWNVLSLLLFSELKILSNSETRTKRTFNVIAKRMNDSKDWTIRIERYQIVQLPAIQIAIGIVYITYIWWKWQTGEKKSGLHYGFLILCSLAKKRTISHKKFIVHLLFINLMVFRINKLYQGDNFHRMNFIYLLLLFYISIYDVIRQHIFPNEANVRRFEKKQSQQNKSRKCRIINQKGMPNLWIQRKKITNKWCIVNPIRIKFSILFIYFFNVRGHFLNKLFIRKKIVQIFVEFGRSIGLWKVDGAHSARWKLGWCDNEWTIHCLVQRVLNFCKVQINPYFSEQINKKNHNKNFSQSSISK